MICLRIDHPVQAITKSRTPGNNRQAPILLQNEPSVQTKPITDGANVNAADNVPQAVLLFLKLISKAKGK